VGALTNRSGPGGTSVRPAVVAGGHAATVDAAAEVLAAGGNAFDAAVAGGCTAAVAEPCLTSLGGGGFAVARTAQGRELVADFFVTAPGLGAGIPNDPSRLDAVAVRFPSAVQEFHVGPASVAVPGVLAGYLHLHATHGRLPLADVLAPPVRHARQGVVVDRHQSDLFALLDPILQRTPTGRELYFRDGRTLVEGDVMVNPALGEFLADIGAGRRTGFTVEELGGTRGAVDVTAEDLAAYEVISREPLVVDHRGARLAINPAPSFGGRLVVHALEQLADAAPMRRSTDADAVVALAGALVSLHDYRRTLGEGTSTGTTHLSVVDGEGNLVAMTTSNGSGSGEFADGLGVQLNNMMGESDLHPGGFGSMAPGGRIGSMMAPGVLVSGGRSVVLGSGGSERIRSVISQLVVRLVDAGEDLTAAVSAPRLHWDGGVLQAEPGWSPEVLGALRERWPVNEWMDRDLYFGGAHLAADDAEVAGDPRRGGAGRVVWPVG